VSLPEDLGADPRRAHVVYRCAQEAVTNAVRHAQAANVTVSVERTDSALRLEVRDDGRGTHAILPGAGLQGLRERVDEAGGRLALASRPRAGFTVRVTLPEGREA
jgi:signal transduction histidine kinase